MNRPRGSRGGPRFPGPRGRGRGNAGGFGGGGGVGGGGGGGNEGYQRGVNRDVSPDGDDISNEMLSSSFDGGEGFSGDNAFAANDRPQQQHQQQQFQQNQQQHSFPRMGMRGMPDGNGPRMNFNNANNNNNPTGNFGANARFHRPSFGGNNNDGGWGNGGGQSADSFPNFSRNNEGPNNTERAGVDFNRSFGSNSSANDFKASFGSSDFGHRDSLSGSYGKDSGGAAAGHASGHASGHTDGHSNFNRFPSGDGSGFSGNNSSNNAFQHPSNDDNNTSPVFGAPSGSLNVPGMPSGGGGGMPAGMDFTVPPPAFPMGQLNQDFSVPPPNFAGMGIGMSGVGGGASMPASMNNEFQTGFNNVPPVNMGGGVGVNPPFRFPVASSSSGMPMSRGGAMPGRGGAPTGMLERGGFRGRFDARGGRGRFPRGRGRGMPFPRWG